MQGAAVLQESRTFGRPLEVFLVKIRVLGSVEKCSDYRGEKRGLASLHASVPWGIKLLAFYCFFLREGGVRS